MKKYFVKSIFGPTIQGEGSHTGRVVKFLRLAGCNKWNGLQKDKPNSICSFCDTDFYGGSATTVESIIKRLDLMGPVKTVVISGGEPTLQIDENLLKELRRAGYTLHLETNGSRALGELANYFEHVSMSPKQPRNETSLEACDDIKILIPVIAEDITPEAFSDFPAKRRFLQPIEGNSLYRDHLQSTLDRLYALGDWSLSFQLHKQVGVE